MKQNDREYVTGSNTIIRRKYYRRLGKTINIRRNESKCTYGSICRYSWN